MKTEMVFWPKFVQIQHRIITSSAVQSREDPHGLTPSVLKAQSGPAPQPSKLI